MKALRLEIAKFPMIPALKMVTGLTTDDPDGVGRRSCT